MGKHLAPKKKHELNFIKKKASDQAVKAKAGRALFKAGKSRLKRERPAGKMRELPSLGRHTWIFQALSLALLIVIRFLPLDGWMVPAAYAIPALLAAAEQMANAYEKLRDGKLLNASLITVAASVLLFATGLYTESVLLCLVTWLAEQAEKVLASKCEERQRRISEILPETAVLVTGEGFERVDPASVVPGDILFVAAGDRIPVDGVVVDGITTIDTAAVSGQRSPWAVNVGYKVYSGCRNLTSDIRIKVSRPFEQSTARRIVTIAESAADFPSELESSAARFERLYCPIVLGLAFLLGVVLSALRGGWIQNLQRAAVLLIASRAVLGTFAMPLLYRKALSLAADNGIFSKGKDCLEAMAKAETVIFDKTGTITEGRYAVTDVYPVKMSERQLLTIAATAESYSRHPIAAAIREAAGKLDDRVLKVIKIRDIPGRGVSAYVGNRQVFVGNAAFFEESGIKYNIPSRPGTVVHVSVDNRYCGYILVTDKVRRRAFDALETLRVNGIKKLVLLTGDTLSVARPIASRLNFDMLRAELEPDKKAQAVAYLMKNKGARSAIAFVGEGENSGRIMSGADVGIAMGSLGSDLALACADVLIMDRDIYKIPRIFVLSKLVYRAAWENFALCTLVNAVTVLFGMFGLLSPLAAVLLSFVMHIALLANTFRIK